MKLSNWGFFWTTVFLVVYSAFAIADESKPATETRSIEFAIFAGGCFWCMQPPFDALKPRGVISTRVGYTGGQKDQPTYKEISAGGTGHREVIEISFDPKRISYKELLMVFWKNVDPYDGVGQFCDKGEQYTSAVFYRDEQQKADYQASLKELEKLKIKVAQIKTLILPAKKFFEAEDYHQSYYLKNPVRYKYYRSSCQRDQRLEELWGKPKS